MTTIEIVAVPESGELRSWVRVHIDALWGGEVARRGELVDPRGCTAFVAVRNGERVGVVTCEVSSGSCEIVTIDVAVRCNGVGRGLVQAVESYARDQQADAVWLTTTNDNLDAIAFYQSLGFSLVARYDGAVDDARRALKPSIPTVGEHGIQMRDELEFRLQL